MPSLRKADRVFWTVILSCLWPGWRHRTTGNCQARDRHRLAPQGVSGFSGHANVAAGKTGPTAGVEGDPLSGPIGCRGRTHRWERTSRWHGEFFKETWLFHRPRPPFSNISLVRYLIAAIAVVADIPYKLQRRLPGGDRFLRGPHGHVPPPVPAHRAPPRSCSRRSCISRRTRRWRETSHS